MSDHTSPLTLGYPAADSVIAIHVNNEVLVTIRPDGSIEYGPNYKPDEAAKIFWDSIAQYMPARFKCPKCAENYTVAAPPQKWEPH